MTSSKRLSDKQGTSLKPTCCWRWRHPGRSRGGVGAGGRVVSATRGRRPRRPPWTRRQDWPASHCRRSSPSGRSTMGWSTTESSSGSGGNVGCFNRKLRRRCTRICWVAVRCCTPTSRPPSSPSTCRLTSGSLTERSSSSHQKTANERTHSSRVPKPRSSAAPEGRSSRGCLWCRRMRQKVRAATTGMMKPAHKWMRVCCGRWWASC
mmetsp:Transcript_12303/g.35730  ORF Transcript_12303/g.35730 Transcript_12303/m.35730 type:complete len:207 (+) Transcript_12303:111-731(+)